MRYDIARNTMVYDGTDFDDEDDRIVKDGEKVRVPLMLMDSVQKAIAEGVELVDRQQMQDWQKAELSARWKGGLQENDLVQMDGKTMKVVGRNPENGKVQLRDTSTFAADAIKQQAYDEYAADVSTRWKKAAAPEKEEQKEPDDEVWNMARPLGDEERVKVRDQMYSEYNDHISNAWRR